MLKVGKIRNSPFSFCCGKPVCIFQCKGGQLLYLRKTHTHLIDYILPAFGKKILDQHVVYDLPGPASEILDLLLKLRINGRVALSGQGLKAYPLQGGPHAVICIPVPETFYSFDIGRYGFSIGIRPGGLFAYFRRPSEDL